MKEMWEERYSKNKFVYGEEPNQFFKVEIDKIKPGKALFIGEGEGRNSVYAATLGWQVDANDWSRNAKQKALDWAKSNEVSINYENISFEDLELNENLYDLIVFIFIHVKPGLREKLHRSALKALKPGGRIILEAYDKDQLKYNSGGPKNPDLLYSLEEIYTDFKELDLEIFSKETIHLKESALHKGDASVIRYVGIKNFD